MHLNWSIMCYENRIRQITFQLIVNIMNLLVLVILQVLQGKFPKLYGDAYRFFVGNKGYFVLSSPEMIEVVETM